MSLGRISGLVGALLGVLAVTSECAADASVEGAAAKAERPAPVTPPPAAVPPVRWRIVLKELIEGMTRGTSVTLDPHVISKISAFPGLTPEQTVTFVSSRDTSNWLISFRDSAATPRVHGPSNQRLSARGWTPLAAPCAIDPSASGGAIVACGTEDALLAFGASARADTVSLPPGQSLSGTMSLQEAWREWGIDEARSGVPKRVDALLAAPALAKSPALNAALSDFGYTLSERLQEALSALNHVEISFAIDAQGTGHYVGSVQPSPGSLLGTALATARPKPAPQVLWRFSESMDSGSFAASNFVLLPFFGLGARTRAFLTEAHGPDAPGLTADALQLAASACIAPDRSLVQVTGPAPGADHNEEFSLSGLEDPGGACEKSLSALVKLYASFEPGGASSTFELLKPGKDVPRAALVARAGTEKSATYLALSTASGFTWVSSGPSLSTLGAALKELALGGHPHHTLADRQELALLGKAPALFGGFVRAETIARQPTDEAQASAARVPFSLTAEGPRLIVAGSVEAQTVRRRAAELLVPLAPQTDWTELSTDKRDASVSLLDATCHLGSGKACDELGIRFGDGRGVAKNIDHAQDLLRLGCAAGHGLSCVNAGFYGASQPAQLIAFQRSCDLKSPLGCAWYAKRLLASTNLEDHKKALKPLELSCTGYSGFGCYELGHSYREGIGVAKDEVKAADYQDTACQLGFGAGCIALGNAQANGVGRNKDARLALKSYEAACKLDKQGGCYALGVAYAAGLTGAKDVASARTQWTVACDAGHAESCRMLAETTEEK